MLLIYSSPASSQLLRTEDDIDISALNCLRIDAEPATNTIMVTTTMIIIVIVTLNGTTCIVIVIIFKMQLTYEFEIHDGMHMMQIDFNVSTPYDIQ